LTKEANGLFLIKSFLTVLDFYYLFTIKINVQSRFVFVKMPTVKFTIKILLVILIVINVIFLTTFLMKNSFYSTANHNIQNREKDFFKTECINNSLPILEQRKNQINLNFNHPILEQRKNQINLNFNILDIYRIDVSCEYITRDLHSKVSTYYRNKNKKCTLASLRKDLAMNLAKIKFNNSQES